MEKVSNSIIFLFLLSTAKKALERYEEIKGIEYKVKKHIFPFDSIGNYIKNCLKGLKKLKSMQDLEFKSNDKKYVIKYKMVKSLYAIERAGFYQLGYCPGEENQFNYGFKISVQLFKKTKEGLVFIWEKEDIEFSPGTSKTYNPFNSCPIFEKNDSKKKAIEKMHKKFKLFED